MTVVNKFSKAKQEYIQVEENVILGKNKSDMLAKMADRFNSTEAELALSKRMAHESLDRHFLKCFFTLKKLAKMSYYQKGVLEEAIKLQ